MSAPAETGVTDILDKYLIASGPDASAALFADISVALNNKSKVQRSMNLRNRLLFQSKQTLNARSSREEFIKKATTLTSRLGYLFPYDTDNILIRKNFRDTYLQKSKKCAEHDCYQNLTIVTFRNRRSDHLDGNAIG
jgi:hypothetical protein